MVSEVAPDHYPCTRDDLRAGVAAGSKVKNVRLVSGGYRQMGGALHLRLCRRYELTRSERKETPDVNIDLVLASKTNARLYRTA